MRRTSETGAFSSAEDANPPWTFSDLEEPSPNRVDLWRSRVTRRHTRVGILIRPMRWPTSRSSRMVMWSWPTSQRTSASPCRWEQDGH